ncbi:MAG: hypothetical protein JXM73_07795 [Anaerolineae bacterium]|nr:hypothetical protein [Anaerolineae bacterium]
MFELFSRNLSYVKRHPRIRINPDIEESYICPICFKLFTRAALSDQYADRLTLEDVPPKSLGGRARVLTCKICNNQAGTEIESHLHQKLRADQFFSGVPGVEIETRFRPDSSVDLTATTHFSPEGTIEINYDPARSDPAQIDRLHELEMAGTISSIQLVFRLGYHANRPQVALLRIGYLLAFAQLGYGFLINANLRVIRGQIDNPTSKILPSWGIIGAGIPDEALGVSVISQPPELRSFLVVFDLKNLEKEMRYGVILPGPTEPGLNVYHYIAELEKATGGTAVEHTIHTLHQDDYLRDPSLAFASHTHWDYYCQ